MISPRKFCDFVMSIIFHFLRCRGKQKFLILRTITTIAFLKMCETTINWPQLLKQFCSKTKCPKMLFPFLPMPDLWKTICKFCILIQHFHRVPCAFYTAHANVSATTTSAQERKARLWFSVPPCRLRPPACRFQPLCMHIFRTWDSTVAVAVCART